MYIIGLHLTDKYFCEFTIRTESKTQHKEWSAPWICPNLLANQNLPWGLFFHQSLFGSLQTAAPKAKLKAPKAGTFFPDISSHKKKLSLH